jgi:O-antigen ligase
MIKLKISHICWLLAGLATGAAAAYFSWLTAFSLLALGLLALAVVKSPKAGIYFILLFVPLELHALEILPGFIKYIDELLLVIMLFALFYRIAVSRTVSFRHTVVDLPLLAFAALGVLSMSLNQVPVFVGIAGMRAMLQYVMLYYVVVHEPFTAGELRRLFHLVMIIAALTVFYGFAQRGMGLETALDWEMRRFHSEIGLRIFSTMGNPNTFGAFLVVMIGLSVNSFYHTAARRDKLLYAGLLVLLFSGLAFTYSRMSLISLFIAMLAFVFINSKKYIPGLLVAAALVPVFLPQRFFQRLLFALSPEYIALSLKGGRLYLAQKSFEVVRMSPWLGVGPGRFGGSVAGIFTSPLYEILGMPYHMNLDNFYFQVWTELGTLGMLAFLWLYCAIFRQACISFRRAESNITRGLAAAAVTIYAGVLFQSLVAGIWEVHQIAVFLWFFAALVTTSFWQNAKGADSLEIR